MRFTNAVWSIGSFVVVGHRDHDVDQHADPLGLIVQRGHRRVEVERDVLGRERSGLEVVDTDEVDLVDSVERHHELEVPLDAARVFDDRVDLASVASGSPSRSVSAPSVVGGGAEVSGVVEVSGAAVFAGAAVGWGASSASDSTTSVVADADRHRA